MCGQSVSSQSVVWSGLPSPMSCIWRVVCYSSINLTWSRWGPTSLYRDSIHCTTHEITPMPYPFVLVTFTRTFIRKTLSFVTFPFKHSHDWDTYSSVIVCRQGHQCSLMYLMTELPDWEVDASYANHPWLAANIHRCSISHDRALVSRLALISGKASMLSACLFGGSPNSSWYIQLVL